MPEKPVMKKICNETNRNNENFICISVNYTAQRTGGRAYETYVNKEA